MARHNREGKGTDQRGFDYTVSYQPDWLSWVKVTRQLESGRQSTKTLFRNPGAKEQEPGDRVRTRITSPEQGLDVEVTIEDAAQRVKQVVVTAKVSGADGGEDEVTFTIEDDIQPPGGP